MRGIRKITKITVPTDILPGDLAASMLRAGRSVLYSQLTTFQKSLGHPKRPGHVPGCGWQTSVGVCVRMTARTQHRACISHPCPSQVSHRYLRCCMRAESGKMRWAITVALLCSLCSWQALVAALGLLYWSWSPNRFESPLKGEAAALCTGQLLFIGCCWKIATNFFKILIYRASLVCGFLEEHLLVESKNSTAEVLPFLAYLILGKSYIAELKTED